MSKELEALKELRLQVGSIHYYDMTGGTPKETTLLLRDSEPFKIVETAVKNYVELTNKPVILYERTNGRTKALIDTICKNYKEVKITNLVDENKTRAFDIIKKYKVNVSVIIYCIENDIGYTEYVRKELWDDAQESEPAYPMEESEFNILKEALK